jgi:hypothetical protein
METLCCGHSLNVMLRYYVCVYCYEYGLLHPVLRSMPHYATFYHQILKKRVLFILEPQMPLVWTYKLDTTTS